MLSYFIFGNRLVTFRYSSHFYRNTITGKCTFPVQFSSYLSFENSNYSSKKNENKRKKNSCNESTSLHHVNVTKSCSISSSSSEDEKPRYSNVIWRKKWFKNNSPQDLKSFLKMVDEKELKCSVNLRKNKSSVHPRNESYIEKSTTEGFVSVNSCGNSDNKHKSDSTSSNKNNKNRDSSYVVGTSFEFLVLDVLKLFGFELKRTGKAFDKGIDFVGEWKLPDKLDVDIVGQCKNEVKKSPAKHIREFEGALFHYYSSHLRDPSSEPESFHLTLGKISKTVKSNGDRDQDDARNGNPTKFFRSLSKRPFLGVFVSAYGFTPDAIAHFSRSNCPLAICTIDQETLTITHFRLNGLASRMLPRLAFGHRYILPAISISNTNTDHFSGSGNDDGNRCNNNDRTRAYNSTTVVKPPIGKLSSFCARKVVVLLYDGQPLRANDNSLKN